MRADPIKGQVWEHPNGDKRKVLRVSKGMRVSAKGGKSFHDVWWARRDLKPGRMNGECSIKSWDRWAKDATLLPDENE